MRRVCIQRMHQRRTLDDDPYTRMAMTMDPPLVALRQSKPTLQIEVVRNLFELVLADEQASKKAEHHRGHVVANRVRCLLESIDQSLELLLTFGAILGPVFKRRGHRGDHPDVF